MLARTVVNQIAYQYLVPALQVDSKAVIDRKTGDVLDIYGAVRTFGTVPGCLACNGLIDPVRLADEVLGDTAQVARQRHVDDPEAHAASVVILNAMAAGWAANDFMQYMVGLGRPAAGSRILRTNPINDRAPHVTVQEPTAGPRCYVCGSTVEAARAGGERHDLPTRIAKTKASRWPLRTARVGGAQAPRRFTHR